jgi:uncharacterized protein YdaU (DUF1376 family)
MPLDWGDYWRDTGHLNALEHGAYLNLLGHYWVSGKPLPDDDARLMRLAKTNVREWKAVRAVVRAFFIPRDGVLAHKRVEREIERATKVHEARSSGARATNNRRAEPALSDALSAPLSDTLSDTLSAPVTDAPSAPQSPPPSPKPDSVPIGTGAHAPMGEGLTAFEGDTLKKRIWGPCLAWLGAQAKLPEAKTRVLVGRWCAKFGDGCVLEAFAAAARNSPLDPVPYLEKVLHHGSNSKYAGPTATRAAKLGSAAREQAAGHLAGLRHALGLGAVASARPDATATHTTIVDGVDQRG